MATRIYSEGQLLFDLECSVQARPRNILNLANEDSAQSYFFFNINGIRSFSGQNLWSFLMADLTFSTCLHRYRCKM